MSRKHKRPIPVYEVYEDVIKILYPGDDVSKEMREKAEKYREKILGKSALETAPQEYGEIGMIVELGIMPISKWSQMPIHDRAKIMAHRRLKSMLDVIDAHYKEQDDQQEKRKPSGGKGYGGGGKKGSVET